MKIYLHEKIGNPDLFTGRQRELDLFLDWIERSKRLIAPSVALLARRKMGKTAVMERLYNLTFERNDQIIPFYYELKERKYWIVEFSTEFFLTFIYQYIAFKTRNTVYLGYPTNNYEQCLTVIEKTGLDYLKLLVESAAISAKEGQESLWEIVRDAPRKVAQFQDERIIQFIDEFQYFNRFIYRDRACTNQMNDLVGSYLHTVEHKYAPMMVSGSWVGWLMDQIQSMLPGRLKLYDLEDLPEAEAVDMIYKYAYVEEVPITDEVVYLMARLTEGNPFYISAVIRSYYRYKDLTTEDGFLATLEYETQHRRGTIRGMWMEYVDAALPRINNKNAKNVVLYLSKYRERQVIRKELMNELQLEGMTESDLDQRLAALAYNDIIEYGRSNFYYQGVRDNIFDKIFRSRYADDIQEFDPQEITNEYKALFQSLKKEYKQLSDEYNHFKGKFAEFVIINHFRYRVNVYPKIYKAMLENLPKDFTFVEYTSVWSYTASPLDKRDLQLDLFAQAQAGEYAVIGEVKSREQTKFTLEEAEKFQQKAQALIDLEKVTKPLLVVWSRAGFKTEALDFLQTNGIAWSEDARWFENQLAQ